MRKRTLYLKKVTKDELKMYWGESVNCLGWGPLYIRCNAAGKIRWDISPIYREQELINRKYKILPQ